MGMSTRKGTAKFLDDILRDVGEKMHEVMKANEAKYAQVEDPEKTADILGTYYSPQLSDDDIQLTCPFQQEYLRLWYKISQANASTITLLIWVRVDIKT